MQNWSRIKKILYMSMYILEIVVTEAAVLGDPDDCP